MLHNFGNLLHHLQITTARFTELSWFSGESMDV